MSPGTQLLSLPVRGNVLPGALCVVGALGGPPTVPLRSLTPVPGRRSRRLSSTGAPGQHVARALSGAGPVAVSAAGALGAVGAAGLVGTATGTLSSHVGAGEVTAAATISVSTLPASPEAGAGVDAATVVGGGAAAAAASGQVPPDGAWSLPVGSAVAAAAVVVDTAASSSSPASGSRRNSASDGSSGAGADLVPLGAAGGASGSGGGGGGGALGGEGPASLSPQCDNQPLQHEVVAVVGTMDGVLTSTVIPVRDAGLGTVGPLVPVRELDRLGSLACVVPWGTWGPAAPWLVAVANLEGDLRVVDVSRVPRYGLSPIVAGGCSPHAQPHSHACIKACTGAHTQPHSHARMHLGLLNTLTCDPPTALKVVRSHAHRPTAPIDDHTGFTSPAPATALPRNVVITALP